MKLLITTVAICLGSHAAHASVETKEFTAKNIVRMEVENKTGSVKISGENTDKIVITAEKIKFGDKCHLSFKQSEEVIEIESAKKSFFSDADCEVNFTIVVPKKMNLEVKSNSGRAEVSGINGKLEVRMGSGNLGVQSSEISYLNAKLGSGNIDIHGLNGNADVKVGSGNVKLTYIKDPGAGELDIKSGSGDVSLFFPPKMRVHSKVLVGSGEAYNEIGDFKDAKFLISYKAGSGNLNIKSSGKSAE
ncbi:MAG: DUF4097 family beta strand repeat-containing protein [Pseudobdellovibrionaceae bacterium]